MSIRWKPGLFLPVLAGDLDECKSDHLPIAGELLEVGQAKLRKAGAFLRDQAGEFRIVRVCHRQPGLEGGAFLDVQYEGPLSDKKAAAGGTV